MKQGFLTTVLVLAAVLHSGGDPHDHTASKKPSLLRQQTLASLDSVKELRISVGDSLDSWTEDATVRA